MRADFENTQRQLCLYCERYILIALRPVNAPTTAQPYTPVLCERRPLFIFGSATRHPVKPNGGSRLLRFENRVPQTRTDLHTIKTSEDHVPCYQVNLKSTVSKHQALKGVEVKANDELYSSACWTWVATHFRGLDEPFSRSGHGGPPRETNANFPPTLTDRTIPASPRQLAFLQHSPA